MTQEEMAAALGVTRPTVSAYENRPNASPSHEAINQVAGMFGIDPAWFYDGEDTPPKFVRSSDVHFTPLASFDPALPKYPDEERPAPFILLSGIAPGVGREVAYAKTLMHDPKASLMLLFGNPGDTMFLSVAGQNLAPRAPQGATIVFWRMPSPPPDTMVLAYKYDTPEILYIKKLVAAEDYSLYLESYVEGVRKESLDETWRVWGAAMMLGTKYEGKGYNFELNDLRPLPA